MFPKQTYVSRREKLRKSVGSGIILLLGNNESPMNYLDNTFHFRQDSTFLYFLGMNHPKLAGVLDCESGNDWIFGDDLTVEDFVWMGPQPTIADKANEVGIAKTDAFAHLFSRMRVHACIHVRTHKHTHAAGHELSHGNHFLV